MKIRFIGYLILITATQSVLAQSSCEAFNSAVELEMKRAAYSSAEGIGDSSAARATMHELKIANSLSLINMNLNLMVQNKCPPRKNPIDYMIYFFEASACETAIRRGEKDTTACKKINDWKGATP